MFSEITTGTEEDAEGTISEKEEAEASLLWIVQTEE